MEVTAAGGGIGVRGRSAVESGSFEIPVWVGGLQKWVTGVNRRTTCDDVVRALLAASGKGTPPSEERRSHYGLVERWRKMERMLEGRSRVLRVWRAWGDEAPDVKLTLRKLSPTTPRSVKTVQHQRPHPWRPRDKTRTLHPRRLLRDHPAEEDDLDGRITDTMDRLMQVIVVQGETIQAQLRRLREQEHQIERFEHHRHRQRVQQIGSNYLLDSYLRAPDVISPQDGDDPNSETMTTASVETTTASLPDPETTAACARAYEALLEICTRLEREEEKLVSLSRLLALEQTREGVGEEGEGESGLEESRSVRDEVEQLSVLNSQLALEIAQNERRLHETHTLLSDKREEASRLVEEEGRVDAQTYRLRARLHGLGQQQTQQQEEKVVDETDAAGGTGSGDKGDAQDTDSNSDTGLSSLHSSEDGGYGLNTLV